MGCITWHATLGRRPLAVSPACLRCCHARCRSASVGNSRPRTPASKSERPIAVRSHRAIRRRVTPPSPLRRSADVTQSLHSYLSPLLRDQYSPSPPPLYICSLTTFPVNSENHSALLLRLPPPSPRCFHDVFIRFRRSYSAPPFASSQHPAIAPTEQTLAPYTPLNYPAHQHAEALRRHPIKCSTTNPTPSAFLRPHNIRPHQNSNISTSTSLSRSISHCHLPSMRKITLPSPRGLIALSLQRRPTSRFLSFLYPRPRPRHPFHSLFPPTHAAPSSSWRGTRTLNVLCERASNDGIEVHRRFSSRLLATIVYRTCAIGCSRFAYRKVNPASIRRSRLRSGRRRASHPHSSPSRGGRLPQTTRRSSGDTLSSRSHRLHASNIVPCSEYEEKQCSSCCQGVRSGGALFHVAWRASSFSNRRFC